MKNSRLFIVNSLLLATIIVGATYLQRSHDAGNAAPALATTNTQPETTAASLPASANTNDQGNTTSAVKNTQTTPRAPTISPKHSVRGSTRESEEYDD